MWIPVLDLCGCGRLFFFFSFEVGSLHVVGTALGNGRQPSPVQMGDPFVQGNSWIQEFLDDMRRILCSLSKYEV